MYWRHGRHGAVIQGKINLAKAAGKQVILFVHIRVLKGRNDTTSSILHVVPAHARQICSVIAFYNGSQEMVLKDRFNNDLNSDPKRTMYRGNMIKLPVKFKIDIKKGGR